MKLFQAKTAAVAARENTANGGAGKGAKVERRHLVLGAGVAGAAAVAAHALQSGAPVAPVAASDPAALPQAADGYRVTQHVLRYYETAKV